MGKGSCDNTKISKRRSSRRRVASQIESVREVTPPLESVKEKQNLNLLDYQKSIEDNPLNMSVTKRVLTKEMAMDELNIRTETGDGLGNCVNINYKNPNSKYPFAVSADCYNVFSNFFGEVIEEIHGDPQNEAILLPQFGILDNSINVDLNNRTRRRARVMYTEISIRRNIEDIPFTPSIEKGDRRKVISLIEEKVRSILQESIEIALVPVLWDKKMDEIKSDLDECGTMRNYPDDRMTLVFKNENENIFQGCILNFDDHVQFIVSSNDGRIGQLFSKIYNFLTDDSMKDINYSAHPIFGHLTLSPLHVGTGMNIRIFAKFPYISRLADANSVVEQHDCSVQNENQQDRTGLMILSNIKSLNISEEEIFYNIIMAFNRLSLLEDELEITTAMAVQDDAMSAEDLDHIFNDLKRTESISYTKKYLTDNIVKQYRGMKTNFGSTFNNCIRHNLHFPRSLFPRACDSNCYLKFSKFFDPILLESNGTKSFIHSKTPNYGTTVMDHRFQLNHPNILSYRVRFNRNIECYPFPMMMSSKDRADVERLIKKVFEDIPVELEGDYCPLKFIKNSIHYEDILSYRLSPTFSSVDVSAGFYRDWPKCRGIFVCKKNKNYPNIMLVILVNVFEHMKIIAIDPSGRHLDMCYERAINMMKYLDLKLEKKYAQKSGYGFLTSFPSSVGCAMRVSALVLLKNLGDKREKLEKECITLQMSYRGSKGHGTIAEGSVFDLSLKMNLNMNEQYIMMMFVQRLKELINIEREFNSRIPKPSNDNESEIPEDEECDDIIIEKEDSILSGKSVKSSKSAKSAKSAKSSKSSKSAASNVPASENDKNNEDDVVKQSSVKV